jgi:hypothetical protein
MTQWGKPLTIKTKQKNILSIVRPARNDSRHPAILMSQRQGQASVSREGDAYAPIAGGEEQLSCPYYRKEQVDECNNDPPGYVLKRSETLQRAAAM